MDKTEMMGRLKERMRQVAPLPDEEDFTTSDETLSRYLKAFEWKYPEAEAGLLQTVEYRRESRPLRQGCAWCHKQPGFHSMRQVGHDEFGRPVLYANFSQATAKKNTADDVVSHLTCLIENAKASMGSEVTTWVFIIDCTGMSVSVCRPKVGLKAASLLSSHYPERLGMVICVNHNPIFHAFWKAIKGFLAPGTVSKMRLLRSEAKIQQTFTTFFSDELSTWLWKEISLNKTKPLSDAQKKFWDAPVNPEDHDPRGCATYVRGYVNTFDPALEEFVPGRRKTHCPHPNIVHPPESSNGDASSSGSRLEDGGGSPKENFSEDELDNDLRIESRSSSDLEDCSDDGEDTSKNDTGIEPIQKIGNADDAHDSLKKTDRALTNGE